MTEVYQCWEQDRRNDALAWLQQRPPEIGDKKYLLNEAVRCADWFPPEVAFKFAPNKGITLADAIPNTLNLVFVSAKLKGLLEKRANAEIEFLQVQLRDHKGRRINQPFFVANVLTAAECLDRKRSKFVIDSLDKTQMLRITWLVLDGKKLPHGPRLFRLGEMRDLLLVHHDLVQAIEDEGCTGLRFTDLEDYGAQFRD